MLADMNVTRSFWLWTRSFLEGRTQQVNPQGALPSLHHAQPVSLRDQLFLQPYSTYTSMIWRIISPNRPISTQTKYADDCPMNTSVRTEECSQMQSALDLVHSWANQNKMELDTKKTKDMWICFTGASPLSPLRISDAIIERVVNFKILGTWLQKDLKWNKHVEDTTRKASKNLYCLREFRTANLPVEVGLTTFLTKIRTILEYCSPVWGGFLPQYLKEELERLHREPANYRPPHNYLSTLEERRNETTSKYLHTIAGDPSHISYQQRMDHSNHDYKLRH